MTGSTDLNVRISEEDIQVVSDQEQVGDYNVKFLSLEGYDIVWKKEQAEQLKQQILNNQVIAEKLEELLKSSRMMRSQLGFDLQCIETKDLKEILENTKQTERKA